MQLFVYEWVVGGGFFDRPEQPPPSLLQEGNAMLSAVIADFAALENVRVTTTMASTVPVTPLKADQVHQVTSADQRDAVFRQQVEQADATILIAPEFEGILLTLAEQVLKLGGRLLSADPTFIGIASDKQETATQLHAAGVRVPYGIVLMPGEQAPSYFDYPAVLKPIDGVGSLGVQLINEPCLVPHESGAYRLETWLSGTAASVAVLCGPHDRCLLEPCTQRLATPDSFTYRGGALPLDRQLRSRASQLALAAIAALPNTTGYVGIDLVLGKAADGSQDYVVEVNPRLTTSYVGLRAATDANLAAVLLQVANGDAYVAPPFTRAVTFDAAGRIF